MIVLYHHTSTGSRGAIMYQVCIRSVFLALHTIVVALLLCDVEHFVDFR